MLVGHEEYCDYHTIQEAVDALERQPDNRTDTLYILSGVYEELVRIYRSKLVIRGIGHVEITMNRFARGLDENGEEWGTFATPTLFLGGSELLVENITVSNTSGQGPKVGQALAVYAHCDQTVFRNCTFRGHQDTLFTGPLPPATKEGLPFAGIPLREKHEVCRQLYQYCYIEGTVDFIFGGAEARFEHCEIHSLLHHSGGPGFITAASTPEGQEQGYVFKDCYLSAEAGVRNVYLGRPWRAYARTDFVDCLLGPHIHPSGWDHWDNPENKRTVCYREYGSRGAVDAGKHRVDWAAYKETTADAPY
ncbi:pectinesterase family protein [Paenibacillus donghaensis]|uniref:Pectinesterase n=1 Tax=Paenibacillus donghaensis TaxID=414771 RepID=A0A2Z2KNS9_9BACL|nr:pectinesterase family protein [Paenibacillus donghaensis]ASA21781.1 pectin methylesterase [Paenibacillus donghaensis]